MSQERALKCENESCLGHWYWDGSLSYKNYKFHELNETSKCHKLSEPSQYRWPTLHMRDTHELNAPVQMTQTRSQTQSKNSIELTQRTLSSWVSLLLNTSSEFQWASLHRRVMAHWVRDWNGALRLWLESCIEFAMAHWFREETDPLWSDRLNAPLPTQCTIPITISMHHSNHQLNAPLLSYGVTPIGIQTTY